MDGKILFDEPNHRDRALIIVSGYFLFNGTSNPTLPTGLRGLTSVTRTAAGIFRLNFDFKCVRWLSFTAMANLAAPVATRICGGPSSPQDSVNNGGLATYTLNLFTAADAALDPAANAASFMSFIGFAQNTAVP